MKKHNREFSAAFAEAQKAGVAAGRAVRPAAMIVSDGTTGQRWYEPEGLCGFAWVTVKPGTASFSRWLREKGYASPAYGGGVQIWIHEHEQSFDRKCEHARKMAEILQQHFPNLQINAGNRLD